MEIRWLVGRQTRDQIVKNRFFIKVNDVGGDVGGDVEGDVGGDVGGDVDGVDGVGGVGGVDDDDDDDVYHHEHWYFCDDLAQSIFHHD